MTIYRSKTVIVRTLSGAMLWMAFWLLILLVDVNDWPREDGLDVLRILAVILVQIMVPAGILRYLRKRERAGNVPGESETFLFDLALSASIFLTIIPRLAALAWK
jgi:membrane protein DedA with SNARE-associated domain